ncbi:hypothetical protein EVJ58_g10482 [Rhodofomes roseus]|uniref:F-box domain-containing protein n=1 Tax=Rhodofomes roseus TaxID=34475 RepID=A0A4Y9XNC7_9APHY|nr:hypothetical protein EVJ58_g10482 [Rhodofomes roseus]
MDSQFRQRNMDASNDQSVASTAATNQHRSHVSIDDLPPDVLLVIFREVLLTVRQPTFKGFFPVGWNDQHLDPWPSYHNLMSPHPFPESITSVCRHWREVMSTVAFFWTRLVIWVGRDPTPLSTVCDYIAWSQNSPLDIHVLCTPEESIEHHTTEKAQVQAVMETLTPHMKRWRVLHMQLFFASSLPRPRIDLVGRASKLVELELLSTVDDCVASAEEAPPIVGEFQNARAGRS